MNLVGISINKCHSGRIWHIIPLLLKDSCAEIPFDHSRNDLNYENIFWDAWYLLGAELGKRTKVHEGAYRNIHHGYLIRVGTYLIAADNFSIEKVIELVKKSYEKSVMFCYKHEPNQYYEGGIIDGMRKLNFLRLNPCQFEDIMMNYCNSDEKTKKEIKEVERQFKKYLKLDKKLKKEKKKIAKKMAKIINSSKTK